MRRDLVLALLLQEDLLNIVQNRLGETWVEKSWFRIEGILMTFYV